MPQSKDHPQKKRPNIFLTKGGANCSAFFFKKNNLRSSQET